MGNTHLEQDHLFGILNRPLRCTQLALICTTIVAAVGLLDVFTANINLAILYAIPVVIAAQGGHRKLVRQVAIAAVVLTFAGYFIGPRAEPRASWIGVLSDYRLLNRTLCALALLAITLVSLFHTKVHAKLGMAEPGVDAREFTEVLSFFQRLTASIVCAVLIAWVLILDLVAPWEFNLAILYAVPLIGLIWIRSRRLLWIVFAILLACTFIGFALGLQSDVGRAMQPVLLRNRILATITLLGCATLLHFAMGRTTTAPQGSAPKRESSASAMAA